MKRVNLNFPEDVYAEVAAAAKRNFRDFTSEVLFRCVCHTPPIHLAGVSGTQPEPTPEYGIHLAGVSDTPPIHAPYTSHTPPVLTDAEPESPLETAELVDMLPADGDARNAKSGFRVRRVRQIECLQAAWTEKWPDASPLLKDNAIRYLQLSDNSAVEVLNAFMAAETKGIKGKDAGLRRYVEVVLKNRKEERAKPQSEKKPYGDSSGWVIRPPTPEEIAEDEEAKRIMMERGLWSPEDAAT